jgi:hypothetical protein
VLTAEDRRLGGWGHPVAGREAGTAPAEEDKRRRGAWRRRKGRAQRRGAPEKGKAACDRAPRPQPWTWAPGRSGARVKGSCCFKAYLCRQSSELYHLSLSVSPFLF